MPLNVKKKTMSADPNFLYELSHLCVFLLQILSGGVHYGYCLMASRHPVGNFHRKRAEKHSKYLFINVFKPLHLLSKRKIQISL